MPCNIPSKPPKCTSGWPKRNIGYPHCNTLQSSIQVTPKILQTCCFQTMEVLEIAGIQPQRPEFRFNSPQPTGVHSYYNIGWDGHVRRGPTILNRIGKKEEEECEKIRKRLNRPRKTRPLAEIREEQRKTREARELDAAPTQAPPLNQLRLSEVVPTDPQKYLIDLSEEIDFIDPCYKGRRLIPLRDFPIAPSRYTNRADVGSQVYPNDFFDFDIGVVPVLERLLGSVLDEGQIELLQEEEYAGLLMQKRYYAETIGRIKKNIEILKERERKRGKELERQRNARLRRERGEDEAFLLYEICAFSGLLTKDAIDGCILSLKEEGYLSTENRIIVEQEFMPWLRNSIRKEIGGGGGENVDGGDVATNLLNSVINEVANTREADYGESMWKEGYENDPFRKYTARLVPPPTPGTSLAEGDMSDDDELPLLPSEFVNETEP